MTGVEWLENEMQKTYIFNQNDFDMFKQAKEMEKQQIIDFANSYGFSVCGYDYDAAEDYHNQQLKNK